jgi:hypothetical protein|nr:MAG TPA: hypothetical protein [Caudoviricetes sp.]
MEQKEAGQKITAYKGFDKNFQCRGFQYEVGKEYKSGKPVKVCRSGFHACTNPLEVWDYYPVYNSRFAEVELGGVIDKEDGSSKICSSEIKIKKELTLSDYIGLCVAKMNDLAKVGDNSAKICSSGDSTKIGSSGYSAKICSSGDSAQIGSSGDSAQIGSSGNSAQIGSSGNSAQIGSSGDYAVIMCAGIKSKAKAKKGSWITLSEWEIENGRYVPVCVKTEQVDGVKIKEDTWYELKGGVFVETRVDL